MRHQVRTKKFRSGTDANKMLLRKMSWNFFSNGKITTTITKVRVLRPYVERIVHLAKSNTESSKNVLLRTAGKKEVVSQLIKQIAPVFKEKQGGYVRVIKIGRRHADGIEMGRLEWTLPVVLEKKEEKRQTKVEAKKSIEPKAKKEAVAAKQIKKSVKKVEK